MKSDDGCSARLTPGEAWAALANGLFVKWCLRCKRFRSKQCERLHADRVIRAALNGAGTHARKKRSLPC